VAATVAKRCDDIAERLNARRRDLHIENFGTCATKKAVYLGRERLTKPAGPYTLDWSG